MKIPNLQMGRGMNICEFKWGGAWNSNSNGEGHGISTAMGRGTNFHEAWGGAKKPANRDILFNFSALRATS